MTKLQEIQALQSFIESIPVDSCIRPWLESVLPIVEADMNSDIIPFITPKDLREEAATARSEYKLQLEAFHVERDRQISSIADESKRVIDDAINRASEIERVAKQRLSGDIARLQQALNYLSL
jgi:hypothetical protein